MTFPKSSADEIRFFVTFTWEAAQMQGQEQNKSSGLCLKSGYIVASPRYDGGSPTMIGFAKSRNVKRAMSESFRPVMLECYRNQKKTCLQFADGTGTTELKPWHIELLKKLHPRQIFFAFDTAAELSVIEEIVRMLEAAGCGERKNLCCHVLAGFPGDTFEDAILRLKTVAGMGFSPIPVVYRDDAGKTAKDWGKFRRIWKYFCMGTARERSR